MAAKKCTCTFCASNVFVNSNFTCESSGDMITVLHTAYIASMPHPLQDVCRKLQEGVGTRGWAGATGMYYWSLHLSKL